MSPSMLFLCVASPAGDDPGLGREQKLARFRAARDAIRELLETRCEELFRGLQTPKPNHGEPPP